MAHLWLRITDSPDAIVSTEEAHSKPLSTWRRCAFQMVSSFGCVSRSATRRQHGCRRAYYRGDQRSGPSADTDERAALNFLCWLGRTAKATGFPWVIRCRGCVRLQDNTWAVSAGEVSGKMPVIGVITAVAATTLS